MKNEPMSIPINVQPHEGKNYKFKRTSVLKGESVKDFPQEIGDYLVNVSKNHFVNSKNTDGDTSDIDQLIDEEDALIQVHLNHPMLVVYDKSLKLPVE